MAKDRLLIESVEQLKNVLFGGKGILVMENPETEEMHTFKFQEVRNAEDSRIYIRHEDEYEEGYVGMLLDGKFWFTQASEYKEEDTPVKTVRYLLRLLETKTLPSPNKMALYQAMRCPVCGRVLTKPESIARGIGPVCVEKLWG